MHIIENLRYIAGHHAKLIRLRVRYPIRCFAEKKQLARKDSITRTLTYNIRPLVIAE